MDMRQYSLLLIIVVGVLAKSGDLYERLHVSRSATIKEIKSAYRREATKWHPDKNRGANAEKIFIEITKAYEVLSNPQKRAKYDAYGVYDLGDEDKYSENRPPTPQDIFAHFFGAQFFPFGQFQMDENVQIVNFHKYREIFLPTSRSTPLLLLGISHFCLLCQQIQPIWSKLANRYSDLGINFGIANVQDDQALREELNVLHSPSILAVVDRKPIHLMSSEFTENAVIEFIVRALLNTGPLRSSPLSELDRTVLATPLITFIKSEMDLYTFLSGYVEDSKPRALLFDATSRPSLRLCLTAFRALDHQASGFIDTRSEGTKSILRRFGISEVQESILVFHENPDAPVFSYSDHQIPRRILDDIYMKNSRLAVPRILSSSFFLDLCPADGHPPSSAFASAAETKDNSMDGHTGHRHLCIVLLLNSKNREQIAFELDQFRTVLGHVPHALKSSLGLSQHLPADFYPLLSPAYIYTDRQAAWLKNISGSSTCSSCLDLSMNLDGQLLALWRITSRILAFKPLFRNGTLTSDWLKGTLTELVTDSLSVDAYLKSHDVRELQSNIAGWSLAYLPKMESLLVDELAVPLWLRIRLKLGSLLHLMISYVDGMWADPLDFFLTSGFTFILLSVIAVYRVGWDLWSEMAPRSRSRANFTSVMSDLRTNCPINLHSSSLNRLNGDSEPKSLVLTPSTYDRLISSSPKGQLTILLCTDTSPLGQRLADQFYQICYQYRGNASIELVPACLFLDRYADWFGWALEAATRIPFRPANPSGHSSNVALTFNPANCRGTVFAINGFRRYFHMYHPVLPGSQVRSYNQNSDYETEVVDSTLRHRKKALSKESRRVANFSRLLGLNHLSSSDEDGDDSIYESEEDEVEGSRILPLELPLLEHEVLAGLPTWFERLFEGSLRRHQVSEWPKYLTTRS
nr:unnamed protein product [Hymenolepis microstoma]CUU99034.1 unnamed protein product [Hymenolepis microstoma]